MSSIVTLKFRRRHARCLITVAALFFAFAASQTAQAQTFEGEVRLEVRAEDGHGKDTLFVNQQGRVHIVLSSNLPVSLVLIPFQIFSAPGDIAGYEVLRRENGVFYNNFDYAEVFAPNWQNGQSPDTAQIGMGVYNITEGGISGQDIDLGYFTITPTVQGQLTLDTSQAGHITDAATIVVTEPFLQIISVRDALPFSFSDITVMCEGSLTQDLNDADCDGHLNFQDNCPRKYNPNQSDYDSTTLAGNACLMPAYLSPLTIVAREVLGGDIDSIGVNPEVNIRVMNPEGKIIGFDSVNVFVNEIGGSASYHQLDGNDSLVIENPIPGFYLIETIAQLEQGVGGSPSGTSDEYMISVRTGEIPEERFGPFDNPIILSGATSKHPSLSSTLSALTAHSETAFGRSAEARDIIDSLSYFTTSYKFGDVDADGEINIGDATYMIARIFLGGPAPVPNAAGDVNCDARVTISDVTYLISWMFVEDAPAPGCF